MIVDELAAEPIPPDDRSPSFSASDAPAALCILVALDRALPVWPPRRQVFAVPCPLTLSGIFCFVVCASQLEASELEASLVD